MTPDYKIEFGWVLECLREKKEDLPWMRNEMLVIHRPIAIAATTLLLFQMAMLGPPMRICFGKTEAKNNCRRRTSEAQSTMKRKQWPDRLKSRKQRYKKMLRTLSSVIELCRRDAHELGSDCGLRKRIGQQEGVRKQGCDRHVLDN